MRRIRTAILTVMVSLPVLAPAGDARAAARSRVPAYRRALLRGHNARRRRSGAGNLQIDGRLNVAAQKYAVFLRRTGRFSHTARGNPGTRIAREGYRWRSYGENLYRGGTTAGQALRAWMASPGHRANILHAGFQEVGFGISGTTWVAVFATPR